MEHLIVKVVEVAITSPYILRVAFDDGTSQIINLEPVLCGYYYAPLRDLSLFNQVRVDPEVHTLVWPNGADFDPATLYNWNRGEGKELAERASHWRAQEKLVP